MKKILAIYDANSGILGELQYIIKKIFFKKHCSLCDITHGYSFSAKKEWIDKASKFPITIDTLHLNEVSDDIKKLVKGKCPCVIYIKEDYKNIIINSKELKECNKSVGKFFDLLIEKINYIK